MTPTIATSAKKSFDCAVQLRDGAAGLPPLFLFPGLGGTVDAFGQLCALIELQSRVFAFQSRGVDGSAPPDTRIERMAERCVAELKRLQPDGPYRLCGHSFGGLVAFEAAQRLLKGGDKIAALVLLDTGVHESDWPRAYFLAVLRQRLRHHLAIIRGLAPRDILGYVARTAGVLVHRIRFHLGGEWTAASEEEMTPAVRAVWDGQLAAAAHYARRFYPGKVIYFSASIPGPATLDPNTIWRGLCGELEVHAVAGGHRSMLDPPYVATLAAILSHCLKEIKIAVGRDQ